MTFTPIPSDIKGYSVNPLNFADTETAPSTFGLYALNKRASGYKPYLDSGLEELCKLGCYLTREEAIQACQEDYADLVSRHVLKLITPTAASWGLPVYGPLP